MTNREFLKSELLKALDIKLKDFGFQVNMKLGEFTRRNKDGWNKYQIVFLKTDEGWELKPSLLLRVDSVEDIFHKTSEFEEKYKKGTPTIGTSIEDYQSNVIAQELYIIFKEIALPFFDKYDTLEKIDKALNIKPEDTSLTGAIFKGSKALIIAKLMCRRNFKELADYYYNYYKNFSEGFYLPNYIRLKEFLENASI
jgi:hypothetical protein